MTRKVSAVNDVVLLCQWKLKMNKKRCHRLISLACKTAAYIIGCGDGENMQIETMSELVQCTAYVNVRFLHFVSFFLISFALFFSVFSSLSLLSFLFRCYRLVFYFFSLLFISPILLFLYYYFPYSPFFPSFFSLSPF